MDLLLTAPAAISNEGRNIAAARAKTRTPLTSSATATSSTTSSSATAKSSSTSAASTAPSKSTAPTGATKPAAGSTRRSIRIRSTAVSPSWTTRRTELKGRIGLEIATGNLKTLAQRPVHQKRFIGALVRNLGRGFGYEVGRSLHLRLRFRLVLVVGGVAIRPAPAGLTVGAEAAALRELARPQLQGQVESRRVSAHLHLPPQMVEAEHVRFNHPDAGRHALQLEFALLPGHGGKNLIALRRFDDGARDHLTLRF